MGFLDVFMMWSIFIIVTAFVLFTVFSLFLGWFLPSPIPTTVPDIINSEQNFDEQRRKLIGLFILVAIVTIMAVTSINMIYNSVVESPDV